MRMTRLAFLNFKSSFKSYLSLVVSLAFTILVFLNFQNIIYSDSFAVLGEHNERYIRMLVQTVSFVLGCFMFFFIWYSTNVFLTKRKREIGTYIFMGLSNQKIGKLYMIETVLIGLAALILGIVFGMITTGLFQMILLALSDIAVDIRFQFSLPPILITAGVYSVVYMIFVLKGYLNIVRSSVLSMISAAKQNEYVRQNSVVLLIKTVLGIGVLGAGYYMAIKDGGQEVMGNVLIATVLVTVGTYLLFGGFIPLVFQALAKNKRFLYCRQRCLWINNMIFRMKKNYRTYAMVCILVLCSVTALATGFAMKYRHDNIVHFRNTYTFQLMSNQADLNERAEEILEEKNHIVYSAEIPMLYLDVSEFETKFTYRSYAVLPYSGLKRLAEEAGFSFDFTEPDEDEVITLSHLYLLSLYTSHSFQDVTIHGKVYHEIADSSVPYLGYLQESVSFYVLNDKEYEELLPLGQQFYTYNYRVENLDAFAQTKEALDVLVSNTEEIYTGRVAIDPDSHEMDWIKVLYSLCIFMFMVFILASGSIMFMKLYNDAFEEKERYLIMRKLGFEERALKKAVVRELGTAYALPFFVMSISSYFSVHALEKMMHTTLLSIHLLSVVVVLAIFLLCYLLSVGVYERNASISC